MTKDEIKKYVIDRLKNGWCQKTFSKINWETGKAEYCLLGAMFGLGDESFDLIHELVKQKIKEIHHVNHLTTYNDRIATSVDDVIKLVQSV